MQTPTERAFRRDGCDSRCTTIRAILPGVFGRSEFLQHDPDAHEEYGRMLAERLGPVTAGVVLTGRLAVDLVAMRVEVNGRPVHVPGLEMRVLLLLARHAGSVIEYDDLARIIWGLPHDALTRRAMQTTVNRLRNRLGPDGWLITTVWYVGLRLEMVTVGELPVPGKLGAHLRKTGWAKAWPACRGCGLTVNPHNGRGLCSACHDTPRDPDYQQRKDETR